MAHTQGPTTQSPGPTGAQIASLKVDLFASSLRFRSWIIPEYQRKYFAPFPNGVYAGQNIFAETGKLLSDVYPSAGQDNASMFLEDAGLWPAFENGYVPSGWQEERDAESASRLRAEWNPVYTLVGLRGDSQLSNIVVTGAKRGVNVSESSLPTRAQLTYQIITSDSGDTIVRFWSGTMLVAEGVRTGNGAITCDAINDSGLSVTATLTYTADIAPNVAFVELRWPLSYQIHYSTGALVFPRTAEAEMLDSRDDSGTYKFLSGILAGGVYNVVVTTTDDDGIAQNGSIPAAATKTINTPPTAPVITSVTGNAAAPVVNFTNGEAGCTYKLYSSLINGALNLGYWVAPAAVGPSALNATSINAPAVANYPGIVRYVVRATNGGVEEQTDQEFEVELDETGAIVAARPNRASIQSISLNSRALTVVATLISDDAAGAAVGVDLFVKAYTPTNDIDPTTDVPVANDGGSLTTGTLGVQRASLTYTPGANGYYRIAVVGRTAGGSWSRYFSEYVVYLTDTAANAVVSATVKVNRGR